jgi:hypothetical protein
VVKPIKFLPTGSLLCGVITFPEGVAALKFIEENQVLHKLLRKPGDEPVDSIFSDSSLMKMISFMEGVTRVKIAETKPPDSNEHLLKQIRCLF